MPVVQFPDRGAGRVLDEAMKAADRAATAAARQFGRGGALARRSDASQAEAALIEQAAMNAASPILEALTTDKSMIQILARGMAAEAATRLHKKGLG